MEPSRVKSDNTLVEKFHAVPMVYKIIPMVLALLYVVAINMELSSGSQRYEVTRYGETVDVFSCLDKDAAIIKQMKLQKVVKGQRGNDTITREKLHIFTKWLKCGQL